MRTIGLVVPFLAAQEPASDELIVIQDALTKMVFTKYGIGENHGTDSTTFSCMYLTSI